MSAGLVPNRALFAYRIALRRFKRPPRITGELRDWSAEFTLPDLSRLDGETNFAEVFAGWDAAALYFAVRVRGKHDDPVCDHEQFWTADGFRVWVDTRDNKGIHRGNRFCRQFCLFPDDFTVRICGVPRATEDPPAANAADIRVAGRRLADGWAAELALPASVLPGFDPFEQPRLGLTYNVRDSEHAEQFLTLGDPFPFWFDPSVWATAELCDSGG
jgi:hypothetical protein